jgi:hypothetical protein
VVPIDAMTAMYPLLSRFHLPPCLTLSGARMRISSMAEEDRP